VTSDPDKLLNQLVVAALTVFIVVILLVAALVLRQLWLQQRISDLSSEVQTSLDDLEEVTEDIQRELVENRDAPDEMQNIDDWEEIVEALDDVDGQVDSLEEDLNEVVLALEPQAEATSGWVEGDEQSRAPQDQVDQVFTIFALLVGLASITIAILLGLAVSVQRQDVGFEISHRDKSTLFD
jgi:hypothetical protein